MNPRKTGFLTAAMVFVFCLAGCGGGDGSSTPPVTSYTVGGTISGLTAGGLVLADGSQTISPASNATSFTFPTAVAVGASYSVAVQTQPSGETCSVSNGSGTVGSSNVTSVSVSCVSNYTIGGTISGLAASGLILAVGSQTVSPASGATSFTFPGPVAAGTSYSVTVQTQPSGETCTVSNGSGTVGSNNVTSVGVTCTLIQYTIGGTISGLTASGLVLRNNSETISIGSGATSFTFSNTLPSGWSYLVQVVSQPTGLVCSITNGSGTTASSNVTNVTVTCAASPEVVLYSFQGGTTFSAGNSDGGKPLAGLITDSSGSFYGSTWIGGTGNCSNKNMPNGCGTIFKLTKGSNGSYAETVLYSFQGGTADGYYPEAGLIMDSSGNLYGTTTYGGTCNSSGGCGTVFKLTKGTNGSYTESVLYSFQGVAIDGATPDAGLIMDSSGNLYGTTTYGGTGNSAMGYGTVFKLTTGTNGSYTESVLYSFQDGTADGQWPQAGLVTDSSGNLYGTTYSGGSGDCLDAGILIGCGTVFKLTPGSSGSYTESLLHSFQGGAADGASPEAGLIMDNSGNLFGTTFSGGPAVTGTVFKLAPGSGGSYTESVLHIFSDAGVPDGGSPSAGLIIDSNGNLYGTTQSGGSAISIGGTVYKLTAGSSGSYTESVLYSFPGPSNDGDGPFSGLLMDSSGNLYGTTTYGGTSGAGTVFEITR